MPRSKRVDASLATYRSMRHFDATPEPSGSKPVRAGQVYTIQKHAARRLHYDLRLELDGVLKSWAITRGPSLDPADKRLAVRTEDHPLDYAEFEGRIAKGNYGAGTVLLWDRGTWEPIGDAKRGLASGKLAFRLDGERLKGRWALVRFKGEERSKRENWLLVKELDDKVDRSRDVIVEHSTSVASGRDLEAIAAAREAVWTSTAPRRKSGARSKLPAFVAPALARLVEDVPADAGWLFEMKFDGYRALAAVSGEDVRIDTRSGLDWTDRYPRIAQALRGLALDGALLDGEITVVDEDGRSNFGELQQTLEHGGSQLSYFVFDLLAEGGRSLLDRPLSERKLRLEKLLAGVGCAGPIFYTQHLEAKGEVLLEELCERGCEGIVAKRAASPYRSGRGHDWLKIKCGRAQEFVIVGWRPSGRGRGISSILVGLHEHGRLRYAGRVGSGFGEAQLRSLSERFRALASPHPAVAGEIPRDVAAEAHWLRPELVAQIEFAGFTRTGLVRHGRFVGLREDKPARTVVRERASAKAAENDIEDTIAGVRLSNPDRVLFRDQCITKRTLALYLEAVSERLLAHAGGRLVSLVRCPEGSGKACFFQRHAGSGLPEAIRRLPVRSKDGKAQDYIFIEDVAGLVAAAQMGVLELHVWGSRADAVEKPDRIVFDLDPDPAVGFPEVRESAASVRDALSALGLTSFALLTGGKGVHVVVPVQRRHDWKTVKEFTRALAQRFAEEDPDRYVASMSKARRKGRIFIDHFRNARAATAIAPYSPRARPGAPVAWPVTWDELARVDSAAAVTLETAARRLQAPDPWADYHDVRQTLKAAALRALGL